LLKFTKPGYHTNGISEVISNKTNNFNNKFVIKGKRTLNKAKVYNTVLLRQTDMEIS